MGVLMPKIDLQAYIALWVAVMLACIPEIAQARDLDAELGRMALGGVVSVSVISVMSGLLRTIQRINDITLEHKRPLWSEAIINAASGFVAGWLAYLGLAHALPAPAVVMTVAACAYMPVLLFEKFNEIMRGKK